MTLPSHSLYKILKFLLIALVGVWTLALSFDIRTGNIDSLEGKYLLGTDSYRFLRQADLIVSEGRLPSTDSMRWSPVGRDLSTHLNLYSYFLAGFYRFLALFRPELTLYQTAVYAPVGLYLCLLCSLFLLWRRVFDTTVGLLAVNLLGLFPSLTLLRSTVGFADRDTFSLLLWVIAILLFVKHTNAPQMSSFLYALGSGFISGLLALTWEGAGLATALVACWVGLRMLRKTVDRRGLVGYLLWYACLMFMSLTFSHVYWHWLQPHVLLALGIPTFVAVWALGSLACLSQRRPLRLSQGRIAFLIGAMVAGVWFVVVTIVASNPLEWVRELVSNFLSPLGSNRLMRTVGELTPLDGLAWVKRYWMALGFSMGGSALLAYRFFVNERPHMLPAIMGFEIMLCGTLGSLFRDLVPIADWVLIGSLVIGSISLLMAYQGSNKYRPAELSSGTDEHLLVLLWFFTCLCCTRGAIRYNFFLEPVLMVFCAYFILSVLRMISSGVVSERHEMLGLTILLVTEICTASQHGLVSLGLWGALTLILLALIGLMFLLSALRKPQFSFARQLFYLAVLLVMLTWVGSDVLQGSFIQQSRQIVHRLKPIHTRECDAFAHEFRQIPDGAVIGATWDYGSMLNWFGDHPTVVDEDHYVPYWIHLFDRHVLAALSPQEALEFLRTHGVGYLMITTDDLFRLREHTYVGSDATFDRLAHAQSLSARKKPDEDFIVFTPTQIFPTPDPLEINGEELRPGQWRIQQLIATRDSSSGNLDVLVQGRTQGKPFAAPLQHLRGTGTQLDSQEGAPGTLWLIPTPDKIPQGVYLSAKAPELLAVRLYLLNEEIPGFTLVLNTNPDLSPTPGGLKVWRVDYPPGVMTDHEYLKRDFPEDGGLRQSWDSGRIRL